MAHGDDLNITLEIRWKQRGHFKIAFVGDYHWRSQELCVPLCCPFPKHLTLFPLLSMPKSVLKTVSIKALTLFQICNIVLIIT